MLDEHDEIDNSTGRDWTRLVDFFSKDRHFVKIGFRNLYPIRKKSKNQKMIISINKTFFENVCSRLIFNIQNRMNFLVT